MTASQQGNVPDLVVAAAGRTEYATVHFHRDVYGDYAVKDTLTIGGLTLTMTEVGRGFRLPTVQIKMQALEV